MFKRLSRSTVYSLFLSRAQFEKFAYDTYLDISTSLNIFMEHATTAFNGKYMVNFKLFKKVLKKLAKSRYPSMGSFSSLNASVTMTCAKSEVTVVMKSECVMIQSKDASVGPKIYSPSKAKFRTWHQFAVIMEKRRLRITMNLIRRFIKRHAER